MIAMWPENSLIAWIFSLGYFGSLGVLVWLTVDWSDRGDTPS